MCVFVYAWIIKLGSIKSISGWPTYLHSFFDKENSEKCGIKVVHKKNLTSTLKSY